jgi:hypothetical protein
LSFRCTIHPVDLRVVSALVSGVKGGRPDWTVLSRLLRKKQMIDRINQPFKQGLSELLVDCPEFQPEIHLWGRPFLIYTSHPEGVARKIAEFYGAKNESEVLRLYLEELKKFSEPAYWKRSVFLCPKKKEPDLGLSRVVKNLHQTYNARQYSVLAEDLGFILAQILGYAYPYWYMDSYGISFLEGLEVSGWNRNSRGQVALFQAFPETAGYLPQRLARNLTAGIYLDPAEVRGLLKILISGQSDLVDKIEQKQFSKEDALSYTQKIMEALTYAAGHGFGLMEATDVFEEGTVNYP